MWLKSLQNCQMSSVLVHDELQQVFLTTSCTIYEHKQTLPGNNLICHLIQSLQHYFLQKDHSPSQSVTKLHTKSFFRPHCNTCVWEGITGHPHLPPWCWILLQGECISCNLPHSITSVPRHLQGWIFQTSTSDIPPKEDSREICFRWDSALPRRTGYIS